MGVKSPLRVVMFVGLLTGVSFVTGGSRPLFSTAVAAQAEVRTEVKGKKLSHEETLNWITNHRAWRLARKTKPIWARAVEAEDVGKEFQTADHAVETARAGYWLCVGVAGEPWFQKLESIEGKYDPAVSEVKSFGFDSKARTYRIFKPKATTRSWVAQVKGPGIAGFFIRPHYDPAHPLYSPSGGYVVRDAVKDDPYKEKADNVWLVQEGLFNATYELIR